jgi:hypothetical protein
VTQFLLAFLQEQVGVDERLSQPLRTWNVLTVVGVESEENITLWMVNSIRNKFVAGNHVEGFKGGNVCCWKSNENVELFCRKSCKCSEYEKEKLFEHF